MRKLLPLAAGFALVLLFFSAAVMAESGLDYVIDAGGPIDALVRGDWKEFFANQPLMGSVSLFVRAPFVWPVFHASISTVYWVGALPCVLALLGLAIWLLREMQRRGRSDLEQAMVGAALVLSPLSVRALHWGHPEELLGAALCVTAVVAASRGRGLLAGLLLGCAIATKQWAVLAALPAFVAAPAPARTRLVVACAVAALAFTLPMLIGNPDRFMLVQSAASSADPQYVLDGSGGSSLPGSHVTPNNVYLPFASTFETAQGQIYLQNPLIGRLAHPLILLIALPLTFLLWRRRSGRPDVREALLLLALLFLARCVLDPMSLDYYHVPFLAALGAAAAFGTLRDARLTLFAAAGLAIAYAVPTLSMYELSRDAVPKNIVYLAVTLSLLWALGRELYGPEAKRAANSADALVQPDDAALGQLAQLDEVAELVGEPEAPAARLAERGPHAADQRLLGDAPAVADFADQGVGVAPDAQDAAAAAVAHAVGGDLVDGEHEVVRPLPGQPGPLALRRREVAQVGERLADDLVFGRVRRWLGQRRSELRHRVVAAIGAARGPGDERMAGLGLGDHVGVELHGVVGADQVEVRGGGEGDVEQRLMALALDELGRAALGPDRLADPAHRATQAGVRVDELLPGGDDARRIGAQLGHVGEHDLLGVGAEALAQQVDLRGPDGDHDRLAGGDSVADERSGLVDERLGAVVEHDLVTEGGGRLHRVPAYRGLGL